MKKSLWAVAIAAAAVMAAGAAGQDAGAQPAKAAAAVEQPKYFQLVFAFRELEEGKVTNSRSYSMTVSTDQRGGSISRNGSRVPYREPGSNNTQYLNAGVNIDCSNAKELQDRLTLNVTANISTVHVDPPLNMPVQRDASWRSDVIVPLRKATVIFSSDDPTTKRQTQLELTATPIR